MSFNNITNPQGLFKASYLSFMLYLFKIKYIKKQKLIKNFINKFLLVKCFTWRHNNKLTIIKY